MRRFLSRQRFMYTLVLFGFIAVSRGRSCRLLAAPFLLILFSSSPASAVDPFFLKIAAGDFVLYLERGEKSAADDAGLRRLGDRLLKLLLKVSQTPNTLLLAPKQKISLRVLSNHSFYKETPAAAWTGALFHRGEIKLPYSEAASPAAKDLVKALRHEYVHAVIAERSAYRCPAWLDEGIAQFLEGAPDPRVLEGVRSWISAEQRAMPLSELTNGFTKLSGPKAAAAYGQSLLAVRLLLRRHGSSAIVQYLDELGAGTAQDEAFAAAFFQALPDFEIELERELQAWAEGNSAFLQPKGERANEEGASADGSGAPAISYRVIAAG